MKNKKKGFSLIEVVMALAVISIGVLPILSMYPSALKMTVKATENEEWSRVTMSILDYVKAKGYDDIKIITSTGTEFPASGSGYSFTSNDGRYTSDGFENKFFPKVNPTDPDMFIINSKGIKLDDYKFSIYMEDLQPRSAVTGGSPLYNTYDLNNNKKVSSSTSSNIIYGIIKIRKSGESFSDERTRDMKFIITPIENWRD